MQAMLSCKPSIVESAASLMKAIVTRNPKAMIKLYSTGAFFFALAYSGSNLLSIAHLFSVTHVHQAFHGGEEAAVSSSLPLAKRSVLGGLLPESLLYVLERSGPSAFAAAMISDSDTPEIIWTHKMREEHLRLQVSSPKYHAKHSCNFVMLDNLTFSQQISIIFRNSKWNIYSYFQLFLSGFAASW